MITYEVPAAALSKMNQKILVSWTEQDSDPLRNILPTRAVAWLRSNLNINDTTRTKLQELVSVAREISQQDAVIRELTATKSDYTLEQTRIRENLRSRGGQHGSCRALLETHE